jgi:hypothetical protein
MMVARVREDRGGGGVGDGGLGALTLETPFEGQFLGAEVSGSAWLRHEGRELVADRMMYDALARSVDAHAAGGGVVTLMDPAQATPTSATRIRWDLANDRIDATGVRR